MTDDSTDRTEGHMTSDTSTTETETETAEETDGPEIHIVGISISDLFDGAPPELEEYITKALSQMHAHRMATELNEWVTAEIADQVLYCYGDLDGTTEPSMADAALINLVRVAYISDEHILHHLNEVEHFHGYVLAISLLAEKGPKGLWYLRKLAKLPVGEEPDDPEPETAQAN
jgi:hypothetical protein